MLRHRAFLGLTVEHFEVVSRNVAGMVLHNSVHTYIHGSIDHSPYIVMNIKWRRGCCCSWRLGETLQQDGLCDYLSMRRSLAVLDTCQKQNTALSQFQLLAFGDVSAEQCRNIPARSWEWLAEISRPSAIMGWAAEHFESNSLNLAGMFLHNSVYIRHIHKYMRMGSS